MNEYQKDSRIPVLKKLTIIDLRQTLGKFYVSFINSNSLLFYIIRI